MNSGYTDSHYKIILFSIFEIFYYFIINDTKILGLHLIEK